MLTFFWDVYIGLLKFVATRKWNRLFKEIRFRSAYMYLSLKFHIDDRETIQPDTCFTNLRICFWGFAHIVRYNQILNWSEYTYLFDYILNASFYFTRGSMFNVVCYSFIVIRISLIFSLFKKHKFSSYYHRNFESLVIPCMNNFGHDETILTTFDSPTKTYIIAIVMSRCHPAQCPTIW